MTLTDALEFAIRTDVGKVRRHNEDAVFGDAALGLMILADGMGGHNAGEVASTMATSLLANSLIGTCLLYTSPSPRDRTRSRMPSSA